MGTDIDETILRVARLPESLRPVPIFSGDPPEHIDCEWLAVSRVSPLDPSEGRASFNLYFVDERGVSLELLPFDTLEIALDQAADISGYPPDGWTRCELQVTGDNFDVREFESVVAAAG